MESAHRENKLNGALLLRPLDSKSHQYEIHAIAVDPRCQGRGLGSRLISAALSRVVELAGQQTISYVNLQNLSAMRAHLRNTFNLRSIDGVFRMKVS